MANLGLPESRADFTNSPRSTRLCQELCTVPSDVSPDRRGDGLLRSRSGMECVFVCEVETLVIFVNDVELPVESSECPSNAVLL